MFIKKSLRSNYEDYLLLSTLYRKLKPSDEGRVGVLVLIMNTKGNEPRKIYKGFEIKKADIGQVGERFADIYLTDDHKPMRFGIETGKVLIRE